MAVSFGRSSSRRLRERVLLAPKPRRRFADRHWRACQIPLHHMGGAPFALLAREEGGELIYAGSAFVTLPGASRDRFWRTIEVTKLKRPVVAGVGSRKASFCRPDMRVRAKHLRSEAMLRDASLTKLL